MRIVIREEKSKRINLRLPTGLMFNRFSALFVPGALKKYGIRINYKQTCQFLKVLNTYRRSHKDWVLAQVDSADGSHIFVKL